LEWIAPSVDPAAYQMQQELRFGCLASTRICFFAVVIEQELCQFGQETNQMESTLDVSFPYSFLRNGMPTLPHPGLYASDVQLNGGQTHIPDSHFDPFRECLFKKPRDRSATESCFKRKIKFLDNSAFEQALAFLPGGAVRFHLRDTRSEEHTSELQSRGHLVCRLLLEKKQT